MCKMGLHDEIDCCFSQWCFYEGLSVLCSGVSLLLARSTLCTCTTGSWRKSVGWLSAGSAAPGALQWGMHSPWMGAYSDIATRCGMRRKCDSFIPKNVYFFTVVFISLLPWFMLLPLFWEVCSAHCSAETGKKTIGWLGWLSQTGS